MLRRTSRTREDGIKGDFAAARTGANIRGSSMAALMDMSCSWRYAQELKMHALARMHFGTSAQSSGKPSSNMCGTGRNVHMKPDFTQGSLQHGTFVCEVLCGDSLACITCLLEP